MDRNRRRFFGSRLSRVAPFRPPWSLAEDAFVDCCTRCNDCIKACPTALLVRGDGGFPVADFSSAACTFCGDCARSCKTGAILLSPDREPWQFTVRIDDACLARQRVECRVCGENCEVRAIRFRLIPGGVALPEIDDAACTGCGACLASCPASAIARAERPLAETRSTPAVELS